MAEQDKRQAAAAPAARARSKAAAAPGPSSSSPAAPSSESPSAVSDRVLLAFVEALEGATGAEQLGAMAPRGLSNVVWAAARLKPAAAEPAATSTSSGHGAIGNVSHELPAAQAPLTAGHAEASGGSAGQEAQGQGDAAVGEGERPRPLRIRGGKTALAKAAAAAAKAEAAAAAAGGGGRLSGSLVSVRLLDAWAAAAGRQLAGFSMQDLSNSVWALGRLGYMPEGMFMTQVGVGDRGDQGRESASTAWAFGGIPYC